MRKRHNILLGPVLAEQLKCDIGAVYPREMDAVGYAKGKELVRGLPVKLPVKSSEIIDACEEISTQIIDFVRGALESTPPEIVADIAEHGIILAGGSSKIYGMDKLIQEKTGVKAYVVGDPELITAKGTGIARKYVGENDATASEE